MIRVGFLLNFTVEYKGGVNYLKNLFYAINKHHSNEIEIVLFVPENIDLSYEEIFSPYATIIHTRILQAYSFNWALSKICDKYLKFDPFILYLLKKNKINCITHSNYVYPFKDIKCINWVPDFQYLHYPELWQPKQLLEFKRAHRSWISKSDLIIVSSYDAKKDLVTLYPDFSEKVKVLHFVSQPESKQDNNDVVEFEKNLGSNFFYLPNQFWLHKNHIIVFKAIKILKDRGVEAKLITTGSQNDFRDGGQHFEMLQQFVTDNSLENNISFFGLVPYWQVLLLMKKSLSIINPSYFEGWSSTVEESKSLDKTIVLSDIPVHKEQNPIKGIFFNPNDENELADILQAIWENEYSFHEHSLSTNEPNVEERTKKFSDKFYNIVMSLYR